MDKYFTPADFSDFEATMEVPDTKPVGIEKPSRAQLEEMKEKLLTEFKRSEAGTSSLNHRAIQSSSTQPTKSFLEILMNDFTEANAHQFIELVKQDYGFLVAEWAVLELFSKYVPSVMKITSRG